MDEVQFLISGYLDDELTADERERLVTALETDASSVGRLVLDSFIHSQLLDYLQQHSVSDQATSAASSAAGEASRNGHGELRMTNSAPRSATSWVRRRAWSLAALAATLLVAVSIFALAYKISFRPVGVGMLTKAVDCRWDSSQPDLAVGALLQEGQELSLHSGTALITFVNGAQLYLEAPVSLRLDSAMSVNLDSGRLAARVPTPARGLTVTSDLATFIDLGTAFTIDLVPEKSFELRVFEGLVKLQLDERFGRAARHPVRVAQVHAVTFDIKKGDVAWTQFPEGKDMPF